MEKEIGEREVKFRLLMREFSREARQMIADQVYETIKHGDDEHKRWLRDKTDEIFTVNVGW